jgi:hypothetical protein
VDEASSSDPLVPLIPHLQRHGLHWTTCLLLFNAGLELGMRDNNIFYIIGVVVVIAVVLKYLRIW